MEKPIINYDSLIRITKAISMLRDPEEIVLVTVEGVTHALKVKGCTVFLFSKMSDELQTGRKFWIEQRVLGQGTGQFPAVYRFSTSGATAGRHF